MLTQPLPTQSAARMPLLAHIINLAASLGLLAVVAIGTYQLAGIILEAFLRQFSLAGFMIGFPFIILLFIVAGLLLMLLLTGSYAQIVRWCGGSISIAKAAAVAFVATSSSMIGYLYVYINQLEVNAYVVPMLCLVAGYVCGTVAALSTNRGPRVLVALLLATALVGAAVNLEIVNQRREALGAPALL